VVHWSTDDVAEQERFAYWREVVSESVLNVATEGDRRHFSARLSARRAADMRLATFSAGSHTIFRTPSHVAQHPEDTYIVSLPLGGQSRVLQGAHEVTLGSDDLVILDGRLPFESQLQGEVTRIIAIVPHLMLDARAPWLLGAGPVRIAAQARFADLARRHLFEIARDTPPLEPAAAQLMTENLVNLLALASLPEAMPPGRRPEAPIEAILAHCRSNLPDPGLTPLGVAAHFGISPRTLHLRFKDIGQSFGRWVLQARLEACARSLADPRQAHHGISDIAYRWGFNDLSNFNHGFRSHFGVTPREFRRGALPVGE